MSDALWEARAQVVADIQAFADKAEEAALSDDEKRELDEKETELRSIDERLDAAEAAAEAAKRTRPEAPAVEAAKAPVISEQRQRDPGHYEKGGRRSWFADLYAAQKHNDPAAEARLREHSNFEREQRDLAGMGAANDTAGGHLVSPGYMNEMLAEARVSAAPILNQCMTMALPDNVDSVTVPIVSTGTAVAAHTENNALQETDAVFSSDTASVYYVGGKQDVSIQLLERSVPGIDEVILADLGRRIVSQMGQWVVNGSGSSQPTGALNVASIGTETYTDASPTVAELLPRLFAAKNDVDTSYFTENGMAFIMHPRRWNWFLNGRDSSNRPLIGGLGLQNQQGAVRLKSAEGVVGEIAGVPVIADASVPTTLNTSRDAILCAVPQEWLLFTGDARFEVDLASRFSNFGATFRAVQPMAFTAARYPGSISAITGTGLAAPTFA